MARRIFFIIFCLSILSLNWNFGIETNNNITVRLPADDIGFLDTFEMVYTLDDYFKVIRVSTNYNFADTSIEITVTGLSGNELALSVKSYEISNFIFPGLDVTALKMSNQMVITDQFYTPSVAIEHLITNSSGDLMEIEDIIEIKDYSWIWILLAILGGVALLSLIVYLIVRKIKLIQKEKEARIDPFEEVERDLNYLRDEYEVIEDNYKEFFAKISEIDRRFVERIYDFKALEMSTSEIKKAVNEIQIHDRGFPEEMREILLYILKLCDRVKYAKHKPPLNQTTTVLEESYELVQKTKELIASIEEEAKKKGGHHEIR